MGIINKLSCPKCGHEPASKLVFQCPDCGSVLEVNVEIAHLTRSDFFNLRKSGDLTIWRWFDFFPVEKRAAIVSLGEGYTPLLRAPRLAERLGIRNLYLKNDTVLPTGSLKDRSNSVGLSKAKELGFTTATVMSTGNAAASVAAYAAAAGLKSVVMVPKGAPMAPRSSSSTAISITTSLGCIGRRCRSSAGTTVCPPIRIATKEKSPTPMKSLISSTSMLRIGLSTRPPEARGFSRRGKDSKS
jgi:threonine synthase